GPDAGGADGESRARRHLARLRPGRSPRRATVDARHRGRRADGAVSARTAGRRRHGRSGADGRAASGRARVAADCDQRRALHVARRRRVPVLGGRRAAHPGHARGARLRMRPRAAIFCFHDVVQPDRLDAVPVTHRPYTLTPAELRGLLMEARNTRRQAIVIGTVPGELGGAFYALTFDDGAASDYEITFPILTELGLRATFFVVPTLVETPGHVTWAQLREMVAAGMEIGSHSLTHPFMHTLDRAGLEREFG